MNWSSPRAYGIEAMYEEPSDQDLKDSGQKPYCPCRSGEYREELVDARGIFCTFYCVKCETEKKARYRPEIFTNSSYSADEAIEPGDTAFASYRGDNS